MISNAWANVALNYVFLHFADPTATGELSTEVFGGGYEREAVTFSPASGRMISNSNTVVFEVPNVTITHISVYTSHSTAGMIAYGALATPVTVTNSDQYIVGPGDFVVSV